MIFEISEVLPAFLLKDRNSYAIASAEEKCLKAFCGVIENGMKLADADGVQAGKYTVSEIPEWRLDEIAWSYNCFYQPDAPKAVKLNMVRNAMRYFQKAGTQSNLDMILTTINQTLPVPVYATVSGNTINIGMDTEDTSLAEQTLEKVKRYLYEAIPIKAKLRSAALELDFTGKWMDRTDLTTVDLSPWEGKTITGMKEAFSGCTALETVNTVTMDTTNVTKLDRMFNECNSLKSVDLSVFNLSNVTSAIGIFSMSPSRESLGLTLLVKNQNLSKLTEMSSAFAHVYQLAINLTGTTNINADIDLRYCNMLSTAGVTNTTFASVAAGTREITLNGSWMAANYTKQSDWNRLNTNVISRGWNVKVVSLSDLFSTMCYEEESGVLDLSGFRAKSITTGEYASLRVRAYGLKKILHIGAISTDNLYRYALQNAFDGNTSIEEIDLSEWDLSGMQSFQSMCYGCTSLKKITFDHEKMPSEIRTMAYAFAGCTSLESADLSGITQSRSIGTYYYDVFKNCSSMHTLKLDGIDFDVSKNMFESGFTGCTSLVNLSLVGCSNIGKKDNSVYLQDCPLSAESMRQLGMAMWSNTESADCRLYLSSTAWNNGAAYRNSFTLKHWSVYVNNTKVN